MQTEYGALRDERCWVSDAVYAATRVLSPAQPEALRGLNLLLATELLIKSNRIQQGKKCQ